MLWVKINSFFVRFYDGMENKNFCLYVKYDCRKLLLNKKTRWDVMIEGIDKSSVINGKPSLDQVSRDSLRIKSRIVPLTKSPFRNKKKKKKWGRRE